jgi:hypothetical protein
MRLSRSHVSGHGFRVLNNLDPTQYFFLLSYYQINRGLT